jgi:uncharacterized repeat protein (TIGR01451 family)
MNRPHRTPPIFPPTRAAGARPVGSPRPAKVVALLAAIAVLTAAVGGCGDASPPATSPPGGDLGAARPPAAAGANMGAAGRSPPAAPAADPLRNRERETATQVLAYPTGDPGTSVILLEKRFPAQARLGKPYVYELKVTNLKDYPIAGVTVKEEFPASFTAQPAEVPGPTGDAAPAVTPPPVAPAAADYIPSNATGNAAEPFDATRPANPAGSPSGPTTPPTSRPDASPTPVDPAAVPAQRPDAPPPEVRYVPGTGYVRDISGTWWATAARPERRGVIAREFLVGQLDPRQSRTIPVGGRSDELGKLDTRTIVTYTPVLAGGTDVINPILKLVREAPRHADLCDAIDVRYVVSNVGVGTETDVQIDEAFPDGLATAAGDKSIRIAVGDLPQGASKPFTVKVRAGRTGEFTGKAAARGAGTAAESAEVATAVHAPKLTVALSGPASEYVGKAAPLELVVTNVGDAAARNAGVTASADGGAAVTFPDATSPGGVVNPNGGATSINAAALSLGTLDAGQTRKVKVAARPIAGGVMTVTAVARSDCADAVSAAAKTTVLTIPSLVMEVTDRDDPVRVGEATSYRVTIKNVGSGPDADVRVSAVVPEQLEYVQATGPTQAKAAAGRVTFDPLPTLAAGQSVTWTVEVKAAAAGDVRFRVEMTSGSLKEPVVGTESTKLY